jgi:hypothetical protein
MPARRASATANRRTRLEPCVRLARRCRAVWRTAGRRGYDREHRSDVPEEAPYASFRPSRVGMKRWKLWAYARPRHARLGYPAPRKRSPVREFGGSSESALSDVASRWLKVYLRDHYAASAGGVALARRALGARDAVVAQIEGDRETLEDVMRQLGVRPSPLKVAAVRMAEQLGRLKPNGKLLRRSPLTPVIELEALAVGIRGKEALWTALRQSGVSLPAIDFGSLADAARSQHEEVERRRLRAARAAFGESLPDPPRPNNDRPHS